MLKFNWKQFLPLLLIFFMITLAIPSFALDGEGGGDGGGNDRDDVSPGSMGEGTYVYEWVPESVVVLRSDLRDTVKELHSKGIGHYSYKAVPDAPEYIKVIWLTSVFVELIPNETVSEEDESDSSEKILDKEREEQAEKYKKEQARKAKENKENQPDPESDPILEPEKDEEAIFVDASPKTKERDPEYPEVTLSDEDRERIISGLSDEDRKVAEEIARINPSFKPVSNERYDEIIANLPEEYMAGAKAMMSNDPTIRLDEKRMLDFVKGINILENQYQTSVGDRAKMIETTLEHIDGAGQKTQTVMSFVPGVGWGWSVVLDGARGGANSYRDGKTGKEIVGEIITNAGISYVTNRVGGGDAFTNAKSAKGEFQKIFSGQKEAGAAYLKQLVGFGVGKVVGNGLANNAKGPLYTSPPAPETARPTTDIQNPFITTYNGQKVMK